MGCLLAALLGDRLGRKNTLRWGALISALGAVLQFASVNLSMLILGRVINGVGNGKSSTFRSRRKRLTNRRCRFQHSRCLSSRVGSRSTTREAFGHRRSAQCHLLYDRVMAHSRHIVYEQLRSVASTHCAPGEIFQGNSKPAC